MDAIDVISRLTGTDRVVQRVDLCHICFSNLQWFLAHPGVVGLAHGRCSDDSGCGRAGRCDGVGSKEHPCTQETSVSWRGRT